MSVHSEPYIRIKDACRITGLAHGTIQKLYNDGKIRGYRINDRGDRRIDRSSLMEFMQKQGFPDGMAR